MAAAAAAAAAAAPAARVLVYEGPFGPVLRILKRVSIFSCGCTLVGVPLLTAFGNEDLSAPQRAAVGTTVCAFAIGTTAALTFVSKPYVWRMYMVEAAKGAAKGEQRKLQVQNFNLFARLTTTEFPLADIVPRAKDRIFSNFDTKNGASFYVHEEPDYYSTDDIYLEVTRRAGLASFAPDAAKPADAADGAKAADADGASSSSSSSTTTTST